jgi:hypothetical protein
MDWHTWCSAFLNARGTTAFGDFEAQFLPRLTQPMPQLTDTDITWFTHALNNAEQKWFVAFIFEHLPVPAALFIPMLQAAVYERDPSFNRQFVEPCIRQSGHRLVIEALLTMFQTGTDFEKAGATNALYWANIPLQYLGNTPAFTEEYATAESRAARNALNDLWQRKRELFLQEFVTNSDVDVRRSLIPALDLNSDSYPDSLRHLVAAAIQIARTHSDDYIRHRVEVQLGTERLLPPLPHRK